MSLPVVLPCSTCGTWPCLCGDLPQPQVPCVVAPITQKNMKRMNRRRTDDEFTGWVDDETAHYIRLTYQGKPVTSHKKVFFDKKGTSLKNANKIVFPMVDSEVDGWELSTAAGPTLVYGSLTSRSYTTVAEGDSIHFDAGSIRIELS